MAVLGNAFRTLHFKTVIFTFLIFKDNLKGQVSTVKSCFTAHHALVGEVKIMLKTLAKVSCSQVKVK